VGKLKVFGARLARSKPGPRTLPLKPPQLWVAGWLPQGGLLLCAGIAFYRGHIDAAITLWTGSIVIGAMRAIERSGRG